VAKQKILLIEDEKVLVELYTEGFAEEGFDIKAVLSAEEGLKAVKKGKPDLVILDILLPKENGIFFLEEMRKDPEVKDIPVVVLSNLDAPETRRKALKLGALDYLIKTDFAPHELIERIKRVFPKKG
jgi:DNA-binding response OmpR family regulator